MATYTLDDSPAQDSKTVLTINPATNNNGFMVGAIIISVNDEQVGEERREFPGEYYPPGTKPEVVIEQWARIICKEKFGQQFEQQRLQEYEDMLRQSCLAQLQSLQQQQQGLGEPGQDINDENPGYQPGARQRQSFSEVNPGFQPGEQQPGAGRRESFSEVPGALRQQRQSFSEVDPGLQPGAQHGVGLGDNLQQQHQQPGAPQQREFKKWGFEVTKGMAVAGILTFGIGFLAIGAAKLACWVQNKIVERVEAGHNLREWGHNRPVQQPDAEDGVELPGREGPSALEIHQEKLFKKMNVELKQLKMDIEKDGIKKLDQGEVQGEVDDVINQQEGNNEGVIPKNLREFMMEKKGEEDLALPITPGGGVTPGGPDDENKDQNIIPQEGVAQVQNAKL